MVIQLEVDSQHAKHFIAYLDVLRAKAANDLLRMQREVDVERMTGVVSVLGAISRAFYDAMATQRGERRLAKTVNA